ncbi:hypothetical protein OE88DRAFT_1795692 [Heliocybe sulcata]|uniref:Zn(2)-C6 fungal-type domain-containing protein n=1 Tax=Heliocybe sulcata TaxID=5364 RepID=A0A5C3N608_9AGAM|nr:hypothetical protein OE88DRAFT_1795692 [Heliocybe sulcata]
MTGYPAGDERLRSEPGAIPSSSRVVGSLEDIGCQASAPGKPKKTRREKPHIDLAPGQPPTTQGKARQRVFVACLQCRNRKIRCDGGKPICFNCNRRPDSFLCSYDATPKRRGPDRLQGARQRSAKDSSDGDIPAATRNRRRRVRPDAAPYNAAEPRGTVEDVVSTATEFHLAEDYGAIDPGGSQGWDSQTASLSFVGGTSYSPYPVLSNMRSPSSSDPSGTPQIIAEYKTSQLPGFPAVGLEDIISSSAPSLVRQLRGTSDGSEHSDESNSVGIVAEPSLCFTRKTWWDSLLTFYSDIDYGSGIRSLALTASQRESGMRRITSDLRTLFRTSNYWFSFFNVPRFLNDFFDTRRRETMQPSLVLAALAVATFLHSSELDQAEAGRTRAMRLRDEAQACLEASLNGQWIDSSLAQAAWLLAFFEVCGHQYHSSARVASSLFLLDGIIRSLSLTLIDAGDPRASHLRATTLPGESGLGLSQPMWSGADTPVEAIHHPVPHEVMSYRSLQDPVTSGCSCASISLGATWSAAREYTPLWLSTPGWDEGWTEAEVRKEECRRLCWSTLFLACGHSSYVWAHKRRGLDLFVVDPANASTILLTLYALLAPGESLALSPCFAPFHPGNESIWALYSRIMLLWSTCLRMRCDNTASYGQKAQFAMRAWLFADAIEDALNRHTCDMEKAFLYAGREYLFNIRMCISHEYQRYIPQAAADFNGIFHRRKADEWCEYQTSVAQRVMHGLYKVTGQAANVLAKRPLFVFHFMAQVSRTLSLWQRDNTYTQALEVSKALLPPIDYLSALWPCHEQRIRYDKLRAELTEACYMAGIAPPPPPNFRLPSLEDPAAII